MNKTISDLLVEYRNTCYEIERNYMRNNLNAIDDLNTKRLVLEKEIRDRTRISNKIVASIFERVKQEEFILHWDENLKCFNEMGMEVAEIEHEQRGRYNVWKWKVRDYFLEGCDSLEKAMKVVEVILINSRKS